MRKYNKRRVTVAIKFDHCLSHLCHCDLHLLEVPEEWTALRDRDNIRLISTWSTAAHQSLASLVASVSRHWLMVPRHRRSTFGRRVFAVAGPTVWNSWTRCQSTFETRRSVLITLQSQWRRGCLDRCWCIKRIKGVFMTMRYINLLFYGAKIYSRPPWHPIWHWHVQFNNRYRQYIDAMQFSMQGMSNPRWPKVIQGHCWCCSHSCNKTYNKTFVWFIIWSTALEWTLNQTIR